MTIEPIFYVPMGKYQIENWEENKKKIMNALPQMTRDHLGNRDAAEDVYTDFWVNAKQPTLPDYSSVVIDIIAPYLRDFMGEETIRFGDMWTQTEYKGQYHDVHNHGGIGWSSVIYVDFDPEVHTATEFISPFNNIMNGNLVHVKPEVQEGTMIIFPATLAHRALPNTSDKSRTIISYNLKGSFPAEKRTLGPQVPKTRSRGYAIPV